MTTSTKATVKATTKKRATKKTFDPKKSVHAVITNSIIEALENGVGSWERGWSVSDENGIDALSPVNASTGKQYTGVNRIALAVILIGKGYKENKWVTYKQAAAEGWQVRRKEVGVTLAFFGIAEKNKEANKDEEDKEFYKITNRFTVFNVAQLDGYVAKPSIIPTPSTADKNVLVQKIIDNCDVTILPEAGNSAYYAEWIDAIQMPPMKAFKSESAYYSTIVHELSHSTKHKSRLNRNYDAKYDKKEAYAREELVAELGAAFLCSEIGCIGETIENHASYIGSWIKLLKSDDDAIFKAAAAAQKASDFILYEWAEKKEEAAAEAA